MARDAAAGGHLGLWTTDGTAGGTKELIPAAGAGAAATGLNPTDMTVFDGEVLFNGADANGLSGLWATDGTAGGTHEVIAEAAGASSGLDPTDMTVFGSEVLFSGVDANGLSGLWVTDGTAGGTHELLAEATGATAAKDPHGLNPTDLTVFNGEVFFNGLDQFGLGQLWETNGTVAGTQMLTVPGAAGGIDPSNFEVYNGQLLFGGFDHSGASRPVDDERHGRRDKGNNPQFGNVCDRTPACGSDCADASERLAPTISGTVPGQPTTSEAPVKPFTHVTIGDANVGATDTLTITLGGVGGTLEWNGLQQPDDARRGGLPVVGNRGRDHQRTRCPHLHADCGGAQHDLEDDVHAQ